MVELITVMILVGVLAAIGVPKMMGENDIDAVVFGDQVVTALRTAQKTAVARRRTVCVALGTGTLTARIASARDSGNCNLALDAVAAKGKVTLANAPAKLFFRPDGTIATDPAGTPASGLAIGIAQSGTTRRTVRIEGSTGFVD